MLQLAARREAAGNIVVNDNPVLRLACHPVNINENSRKSDNLISFNAIILTGGSVKLLNGYFFCLSQDFINANNCFAGRLTGKSYFTVTILIFFTPR